MSKGKDAGKPGAKESAIEEAKHDLDVARHSRDQLRIDLAEDTLNKLLEEYPRNSCHT